MDKKTPSHCPQCAAPRGEHHKMSCSEPGGRKGHGPIRPFDGGPSVAPGDVVTWGSGVPVAKVIDTFYGEDTAEGQTSLFARVTLLKEQVTPCGKRWAAGTEVNLPTAELRPLDTNHKGKL